MVLCRTARAGVCGIGDRRSNSNETSVTLGNLLIPLNQLLRNERIGYAVIGGYAVAAWGVVRATRDLDLLCETADLNHLKEALKKNGFRFEFRKGDAVDPIAYVLRIKKGPEKTLDEIEILAGIRGAQTGIIERAHPVKLQDILVPVASPEDTVILKLIAGSNQDLEDLRGILRVQGTRFSRSLACEICPAGLRNKLEAMLA